MEYKIGQIIFADDTITVNDGRDTVELVVNNSGDRVIQVCSHYHFFEANIALKFDREKAFGYRLDVPAGTAVRFEPGEDKRVRLVPYGGDGTLRLPLVFHLISQVQIHLTAQHKGHGYHAFRYGQAIGAGSIC